MAHSIIEFHGKNIRVHDLDLAIACFLLMRQGATAESMANLFEDWVDSISCDGPGCIDLHLDEHLANAATTQALKELIESTIKWLSELPALCSKDELNPLLARVKISLESDYRVDLIQQTLIELRSLFDYE